ncbi:integrase [Bacterioplanes sanyensis]|uniref:Integrase n=2 Tax=Bacterioplanes sanyensis TaxID=1249553 RepID=A0A222FRU7_9GAMM|nr:integrase [Bacterioplanes sanyensis]
MDHIGNPLNYTRAMVQALPTLQSLPGSSDDFLHSLTFLLSYNGSSATFNSYRREVERLLQWTWFVEQTTLPQLRRQQLEEYVHFCQSPPPAWIGQKQVARFKVHQGQRVANGDWRPFVTQADKITGEHPSQFALSQKSLQSIFSVLSTYFNYLLQEDYLEINPISLIRQKSKFIQRHAYKEPIRRISNLQWDYVLETVEQLAEQNPTEHERSLFVMHCLYGMYLRISELVADERSTPTMGDFHADLDGNWWLRVIGKGNKARLITVSDDMLASLKRYRLHLGLPALPHAGEQTPLVTKLRGRGPVTSTRQIRNLVQHCFDSAYQRMAAGGLQQDANELRVATVHWLRHTGISEDVRVRPKEHVKEDAGHASMATTDRYIDTELRERHASARHKRLRPDYD